MDIITPSPIYTSALTALLLIGFGLFIYCLLDILKSEFRNNDRLIWVFIILFIPLLGPMIYLIMGKGHRSGVSRNQRI